MDFQEPSKGYHNYVWDTQAINALAADDEMIALCRRALEKGHRFFVTEVQERELDGVPDRTLLYDDSTAWGQRQDPAFSALKELGFKRLSCVAVLYKGFPILDGSMRIFDDSGPLSDMFCDIDNNNNHHRRDAITAEAAVFHECTLITDDKRLRNKVNKHFPASAVTYNEYKNALYRLFSSEELDNAD